jgi:hypothetical protein
MATSPEIFNLIESRTISGKGLFEFAYNPAYRAFRLFTQVVRMPVTNYNNYKWNPPRSEYAKITWGADSYTLKEDVIHYQSQRFDWVVDSIGDDPFYSVCALSNIITYFNYLAPFVGATPIAPDPTNLIFFQPLSYYFDQILINCRDDTAITADLWGLKYNQNCADATANPNPQPGSPAKIPPLPPGQPIGNISPPYNPSNSDNGNTQPYPGDGNPVEPCVSIVRGAGVDPNSCAKLSNQGDYTYNGYVELVPVTVPPGNCSGLRVFLNGVDQGLVQTYYPDATVISRTGNCVPPPS